MRYIKVLVLAVFLFLALIFFFQNQAPLSQQMEMSLDLFFIPPMKSIALPFYFLVIAAFFIGCLLTLFWLVWDKFMASSRLMKAKWQISRLQSENDKLQKLLNSAHEKAAETAKAAEMAKEEKPSLVKALPEHSDAPADEQGKSAKA